MHTYFLLLQNILTSNKEPENKERKGIERKVEGVYIYIYGQQLILFSLMIHIQVIFNGAVSLHDTATRSSVNSLRINRDKQAARKSASGAHAPS